MSDRATHVNISPHPIEWFGHHQVVYCIGDEDILKFDGIACEDCEANVVYSYRAEAVRGQSARRSLSDDETTLSVGLLVALTGQSVVQHIYENGAFEHLWNIAQHAGNFAVGSGQRIMPILLFRLGGVDCKQAGREEAPPERIREAAGPYVRALRILKDRGFVNTLACSVSQDARDSASAVFNAELARLLPEAGIAYLDMSTIAEPEIPRRAIELLATHLRTNAIL
jgi:hypothetical protein